MNGGKLRILLQVSLILSCFTFILNFSWEQKGFAFGNTPKSKVPKIIPMPVIYGKRRDNTSISDFNVNLAIVEVVSARGIIEQYRTAIGSMQCYALMKGHYMYLLDMDEYKQQCGHHNDFFYKRHCVIANLMETRPHDWYVFLDSDMEVVNPNRTFHEFIDSRFDVMLYDRFFNWEIVAGSYIVRGTQFGRDFVRNFANFEFEHPQIKEHGTDNGAIQAYVAEIVLHGRDKIHECWEIWQNSKGWDDIFDHEWCVRKVLGDQEEFDRLKIFRKGTAWARDGGLTNGKWNPEIDFILHGRKEVNHNKVWNPNMTDSGWYDARVQILDLKKCEEGNVTWQIRQELVIPKNDIIKRLNDSAHGILPFLKVIYNKLNKTEVIEDDIKQRQKIIDHFSNFKPKLK